MEWLVPYISYRVYSFHSVTLCCSVPHRTVAAAFNWISWYTNTLIAFDDLVESVKPVAFLKV